MTSPGLSATATYRRSRAPTGSRCRLRRALRRLAKAPWAMHYNRLIVLVLAANALLAAYVAGHGER